MLTGLAVLVALAGPPAVHEAVALVTPTHMTIKLSGEEPSDLRDEWAMVSPDDPNYARVQYPEDVVVKAYPVELIPEGWPYPHVKEYEVLLVWSSPLQAGASYELASLGSDHEFDYLHDPENNWTPSLKVNQVGYLPDVLGRYAYLSYWLGRAGPMDLMEGQTRFRVIRSDDGAVIHTGDVVLRAPADQATEDAYGSNYSQATIYDVNLFRLIQTGTYHIVWDGVGRSWDFEVEDDVYDGPFKTTFKALYHQRCGTALEAEYTPYVHEPCHVAPVVLSNFDMFGEGDAFEGLPAQATEEAVDVHGGYHDAGDYDRRVQHLDVVDMLVDLYEIDQERFARDDLGIPESGNGVPDVIDEARWGVEFFRRLQDEFGGVRAGVETTSHPDGWNVGPAEDTTTTWYAFAPSYLSSYRYAAAAAKLARAIRAFDEDAARLYLASATSAWEYAEANRPIVDEEADEEPLDDGVWDAMAAVELFKTTGQSSYNASFIEYMPFRENDLVFSIARYEGDDLIPPMIAYVGAEGASAEHVEAVTAVLTSRANYWLDSAGGTGYRLVKHPYAPLSNGSYTTPRHAVWLFQLYELFGDDRYLEWGIYTCDMTLGTNPSGRSWVTGLGDRPVTGVLHLPSMADDIQDPVPGITVYGPCASNGCRDGQGIIAAARAGYRPEFESWPPGERYADVGYVPAMNEFTIMENIAPTVFAFGYLAQLDGGVRPGGGEGGAGGEGGTQPGAGGSGGGGLGPGGSGGAAGSGAVGGGDVTGGAGGSGGSGGSGGEAGAAGDPVVGNEDAGGCDCNVSQGRPGANFGIIMMILALVRVRRRA